MATLVLLNPNVLVNAVNLSAFVRSVSINYKAEIQDDTAGGDTSRSRIGGLKDWDISLELNQDFAASAVDATLFPLVGASFAVDVRPTSAARSATNPSYTGTGILPEYAPLGTGIGELVTTSIAIQCADGVALQRLTA